jgi:hypothetical protein
MKINSLINSVGLAGLILVSLIMSSCDIKENNKETDPKNTFVKIYENQDFSQAIIPIDIKQTSDGGFIHLAKRRIPESSFYGIYVMKTNALGEFVSEQMVSSDYVNPVFSLMKSGNLYFFFCMDINAKAKLMSINENGQILNVTEIIEVIYPLNASLDESSGQFILQHYNRDEKRTVVSLISANGTITSQREFNVGDGEFDVEEPIIKHLTGIGKSLPFLTGSVGSSGTYYFNGFYKYHLTTVFFNFGSAVPGLLQGYRDERNISSLKHVSGTTFAVSRYAFGENYFIPNATINSSSGAIASSSDLLGNPMMELNENAKVVLKSIIINGRKILIYNSDTKSKQIALFFYEESSGTFLGSRHYGYSNPYEVGNFISTDDGGLAIVGTTYLAGRFPRIVLIKIGKEELEEIVK